jgi:toxin-antitoxin system PIN domain toxin
VIVDANLLLYAVDTSAPDHGVVRPWLEDALNGRTRVGLPWPSLLAFVRIATHPRASRHPLEATAAWHTVETWLSAPAAWIPEPTTAHAEVLGDLIARYAVTGNLVPDAHLAALAIQHGVPVASADSDFARFREVRWFDPRA